MTKNLLWHHNGCKRWRCYSKIQCDSLPYWDKMCITLRSRFCFNTTLFLVSITFVIVTRVWRLLSWRHSAMAEKADTPTNDHSPNRDKEPDEAQHEQSIVCVRGQGDRWSKNPTRRRKHKKSSGKLSHDDRESISHDYERLDHRSGNDAASDAPLGETLWTAPRWRTGWERPRLKLADSSAMNLSAPWGRRWGVTWNSLSNGTENESVATR